MDVFFGHVKGEIPVLKFEEECWHCNACVLDCPEEAVSLRVVLPAMMLYADAVKEGRK
jgi:adenylylsulfate reductase subunit B